MLNRGLDKLELLRIVDAVANEKSIDKEIVIGSMESAIQKAALTKFGNDNNIEVIINRENGEIKIHKVLEVVEKVEDSAREVTLDQAKKITPENENLKVGEKIYEELPQIDFGRIAAQSAKQVISTRVREAEKNRQYEDFIDKQGQILSGIIKRLEYGNVIIDLGKAEGVIKKDELIPREILKTGDRVKAYCYEVKKELKGHQIFLSRAHPQFLAKLFFQEVPEIYEGTIEIKSVARDPGSRAKICVFSQDASIDPVGACVGMRGSRVQAVVNELQGEKIDIVTWSDNQATFLANALAPAEVSKIFLFEEKSKVEVVIPDDQLSLAIGRKGQNVKLASNLTSLEIDILTEDEEAERRQQEFKEKSVLLAEILDVEDVIAQLLVTDGYTTVDSIASETLENLERIEGFDSSLAQEIIDRSKSFVQDKEESNKKLIEEKISDEKLKNLKGMNNSILAELAKSNILNVNDFADLATFELIDKEEGILKQLDIDEEIANNMIMEARSFWSEEQNKD